MLDNFGMGEFLLLAFFALLFFGPERLPQIGARLGRWLAQLTQYSKAFMTQWGEEAIAIQDAVQEVKGIRDEIRAAQAEISQSITSARQDVTDTIDEARGSIREATPTAGAVLAAGPPTPTRTQEAAQTSPPTRMPLGNDTQAIDKSKQVVDELLRKRGLIPESEDDELEGEEQPGGDGAEPAASAARTDGTAEDEAPLQNLEAAQEMAERDAEGAATGEAEQGDASSSPDAGGEPDAAAPSSEAEDAHEAETQESALGETQGIADRPVDEELEAPVAQEGASPEAEEQEIAPEASAAEPSDGAQHAKGLAAWVSLSQFSNLRTEVIQLRQELRALREELQGLHARESSLQEAEPEAAADGGAGQVALPVAEGSAEAVSMEEAA